LAPGLPSPTNSSMDQAPRKKCPTTRRMAGIDR
jgi:hypothetical protein